MKYLGGLSDFDFFNQDIDTQNEILQKGGLFKLRQVVDFNFEFGETSSRSKREMALIPTQELTEEFASYILFRFKMATNNSSLEFLSDFNNEIYGLEPKEQKSIALSHFNRIYKDIRPKGFDRVELETSNFGIEVPKSQNRMRILNDKWQGLKSNLCQRDLVLQYLVGNQDFFDEDLLASNSDLETFLHFKLNLDILVKLNAMYRFEPDRYFSDSARLMKRYEQDYKDLFFSFELFEKVYQTINNFKRDIIAYSESLFAALVQLDLITAKKKPFIDYLNNEHGMELKRIRSYEPEMNRQHDLRLRKFKVEYSEFA